MATLWGGRFEKETEQAVYDFNASIRFDKRLLNEDIEGSIVHARMLGKQGILTAEEAEKIEETLVQILDEVKDGRLTVSETYEDVHSFVEATLIERIQDIGKKLHTGRSRNDQVALDMRLYTRNHVDETAEHLYELLKTLLSLMEEHQETIMPGFTHLQKAQPTSLAHHLGAYFEMFRRDRDRLGDIRERMNVCPLGSGALAGTTYPLDRDFTAKELGFTEASRNSMDGVSDRDYLIEYLSALSIIMMHLSRFSEEIIIWNSNEYRFVELDDAYSTGSSIMPQKKNPDIAELAYNKDMQEDKELAFDAMDTVRDCILLFRGMLSTTTFRKDVMRRSASKGFTNATDAADYLVKKGVPFRDAHGIIGRIVLTCMEKDCAIDDLSIHELQRFSEAFGDDVYEAISMETCVNERLTAGAPGKEAMVREIALCKEYLNQA